MSGIVAFLKKYDVAIGLTALIVGGHWGWYKLQFNDALVTEEERKDDKVIRGVEKLKKSLPWNKDAPKEGT